MVTSLKKTKTHFNIKSCHFHKQCNCGTVYLQGPLLKYIWQVRLIFFSFNSAKLKKKREMCVQTQPWNSRATNQFSLRRFSGPGHLNADKLSWGHWTCSCDFGDVYISSIYFGWFIYFKIAFHLGRALWNKHLNHVNITFIPCCCWYLRNQEFKTLSTAWEAARESGLNTTWTFEGGGGGGGDNSKMLTLRHSHVTRTSCGPSVWCVAREHAGALTSQPIAAQCAHVLLICAN